MTELELKKSKEIFTSLKAVAQVVDEMSSELQPAIEALDEKKKEKTKLTESLRSAVLAETSSIFQGSWFDDKVSTYHDRELEVVNEGAAIRQIIAFADSYLERTGVDIIGSLLKLQLTNVKARVEADPSTYGLVGTPDEDGVIQYDSKGMKLRAVKKVRVARDLN